MIRLPITAISLSTLLLVSNAWAETTMLGANDTIQADMVEETTAAVATVEGAPIAEAMTATQEEMAQMDAGEAAVTDTQMDTAMTDATPVETGDASLIAAEATEIAADATTMEAPTEATEIAADATTMEAPAEATEIAADATTMEAPTEATETVATAPTSNIRYYTIGGNPEGETLEESSQASTTDAQISDASEAMESAPQQLAVASIQ